MALPVAVFVRGEQVQLEACMNIRLLVVLAGLCAYSCPVLAGCVVSETSRLEFPHRLNLSEEECKLVEYGGGAVITISVRYPDMEVVRGRAADDSVVTFRLVYISNPNFDAHAATKKSIPVIDAYGVQVYETGSSRIYKFVSHDGVSVEVREGSLKYEAFRLHRKNIYARYQYSKKHPDFKVMDKFAVIFLHKILDN